MKQEGETEIRDATKEDNVHCEIQIKEEDNDLDIKLSPTMYGRIWRGPDRKDGKPGFLMACPMCDVVIADLPGHIKANHKGTDWRGIKTPCPFEDCDKVIVDIQNHIRLVHLKIRNYACDLCDAKFSHRGQVRHHMNGVHSDLREKCPHCEKFLKINTLEVHIKNVHEGGGKRVACTEEGCMKTFVSRNDMERHIACVHMKLRATCPECGKSLRMDALANHIKTQHQQIYPFICKQCGKGYQLIKDLHTHIRNKHYGDFVFCEILNSKGEMCAKKLRNEEALQKHVERVHLKIEDIKNPKVICPECGIQIYQESLQRHIDSVHLKIKHKSCTFENCGEIFTNKYSLQRHVDKVHDNVVSQEWCEICEEFKQNLKSHIRRIHMENERIPCKWPQCDYKAKTSYRLQKHIKAIHEEKPRATCDECGKSVKDLYNHKKVIHRRVDSHFCQECDKGFPTKSKLRDHVNKIHLKLRCTCPDCGADVAAGHLPYHRRFVHDKRMAAVCDVDGCEVTFTSKQAKMRHIEQVHEGICDTCPECGKKVKNLLHHIKLVHKKERNYKCDVCDKTYQTKQHLQHHIKTAHLDMKFKCEECGNMVKNISSHMQFVHNGVRNFPCDQCETSCKTSTALKLHILSVHMGAKERCKICNKDIAPTYMKKHLRKHIKKEQDIEKPHVCEQCGKGYRDPGSLKKHVIRTHLGVTEECPRCGMECKDLYRHMKYTNCESEMYTPRRRKISKSKAKSIHSYFPASLFSGKGSSETKVNHQDQELATSKRRSESVSKHSVEAFDNSLGSVLNKSKTGFGGFNTKIKRKIRDGNGIEVENISSDEDF